MEKSFDSTPIYYVYVLKHPDTLRPFYVGKGHGKRMYRHEAHARNHRLPNKTNGYLYRELRGILDSGKRPAYEVAHDNLTEIEAFALEVALIEDVGLDNLCNCVLFSPNSQTKSRGKLGYRMAEVEKARHRDKLNSIEVKSKCGLAAYRQFHPNATEEEYVEYGRKRQLDADLKLLNKVVADIRRKLIIVQKPKRVRDTTRFPLDEQGKEYRLCPQCGKRLYYTTRSVLLEAGRKNRKCHSCINEVTIHKAIRVRWR